MLNLEAQPITRHVKRSSNFLFVPFVSFVVTLCLSPLGWEHTASTSSGQRTRRCGVRFVWSQIVKLQCLLDSFVKGFDFAPGVPDWRFSATAATPRVFHGASLEECQPDYLFA